MWLRLFYKAVTKQVTAYSFRQKFYALSISFLIICLFRAYLMTLDTVQTKQHLIARGSVNELGRMWKEAVTAQFEALC
jgi:hypothetical protein